MEIQYCMLDAWPCLYTDAEAWQYYEDHWREVDSADAGMNASVLGKDKYDALFADLHLPPLPKIAFSAPPRP